MRRSFLAVIPAVMLFITSPFHHEPAVLPGAIRVVEEYDKEKEHGVKEKTKWSKKPATAYSLPLYS